jgi:hypothetical protein
MIDTLEYVQDLEASGLPRAQAEAHARALRGTHGGRARPARGQD